MKTKFLFFTLIINLILPIGLMNLSAQVISIGHKDSIRSEVLNETRRLLIKLPEDYHNSGKSYTVLYRLDGDINLFTETIGTVNRLAYADELIDDMIIVMIENTQRDRDMMPTQTVFFQGEPGAEKFKSFIENELIPYINITYRSSNQNILCGQSLSSIFTFYCFLSDINSFDSYIACSGGFPDCENYFNELINKFVRSNDSKRTKIFITYGAKDFLDPDGVIRKQMFDFEEKVKLIKNVNCQLKIYEEEGHVPFQSLYHGLKYIFD